MARRRLEFSDRTKEAIRRRARYKCEDCGKDISEVELVCHHRLMCQFAKLYPEISGAVITSIANGECLCTRCHRKADKYSKKHHAEIAEELGGHGRQRRFRGM